MGPCVEFVCVLSHKVNYLCVDCGRLRGVAAVGAGHSEIRQIESGAIRPERIFMILITVKQGNVNTRDMGKYLLAKLLLHGLNSSSSGLAHNTAQADFAADGQASVLKLSMPSCNTDWRKYAMLNMSSIVA